MSDLTTLKISIPQKTIDEAAGKELESAKRKIKTLEKKVSNLEAKVAKDEQLVSAARNLKQFIDDNFAEYWWYD